MSWKSSCSLAKRRGCRIPVSEIYGGLGSVLDYGPLGVELKKNIKERWWRSMVHDREDIEGLDAAILMHPRVWEASGHVRGSPSPSDCKQCKNRFRRRRPRIRHSERAYGGSARCAAATLTAPRMLQPHVQEFMVRSKRPRPVVYLRPRRPQGIYVKLSQRAAVVRQKIPFGIAQIGKAFRNEITPELHLSDP